MFAHALLARESLHGNIYRIHCDNTCCCIAAAIVVAVAVVVFVFFCQLSDSMKSSITPKLLPT